jgi:hypothetical protein
MLQLVLGLPEEQAEDREGADVGAAAAGGREDAAEEAGEDEQHALQRPKSACVQSLRFFWEKLLTPTYLWRAQSKQSHKNDKSPISVSMLSFQNLVRVF